MTRTALAALRCMSLLDIRQMSVLHLDCASCAPTPQPRGLRPAAFAPPKAAAFPLPTTPTPRRRLRGGRSRQRLRLRLSPGHRCKATPGRPKREPPAPDGKVIDRLASQFGSQALSNHHVSVEHRCLTLQFSGRGSGQERTISIARPALRCNCLLGHSRLQRASPVGQRVIMSLRPVG
jgi:hypothetical protein